MPKINEKDFINEFAVLAKLAQDISSSLLRSPTEKNASSLLKVIDNYSEKRRFLTEKELTNGQKNKMDRIKFDPQELRRLKSTAKELNAAKLAKEAEVVAKNRQQDEICKKAEAECIELEPRVEKAAKAYLDADIDNSDALLTSYRNIRNELQKAIDKLPTKMRAERNAKLNKLSHKVNEHEDSFNLAKRVKIQIDAVVACARSNVKSMTIGDMILSIAPDTTKEQVRKLLGSEAINALALKGKSEARGQIVLANLPVQTQLTLVEVLSQQLIAMQPKGSTQVKALQQFTQALIQDLKDINSGEKTHISLVSVAKGKVHVLHVGLREFVADPRAINKILFVLLKEGLAGEAMEIKLTNPSQAAALSSLGDINPLSLEGGQSLATITNKVMQIAGDRNALMQYTKKTPEAMQMAIANVSKTKPLTPKEVQYVLSELIVLRDSKSIISASVNDEKGDIGLISKNPQQANLLMGLENHGLTLVLGKKVTNAQSIVVSQATAGGSRTAIKDPVEIPRSIDIKPRDTYIKLLVESRGLYLGIISRFANIVTGLETQKNKNAKYEQVVEVARRLLNNLINCGSTFFDAKYKDITSVRSGFDKFKEDLNTCIGGARGKFAEHRGLWEQVHPILKAILGIISILSVLPGIGVAALSKKGLVGTFFAPQEKTESEQKLDITKSDLDSLTKEIDQKLPPANNLGNN